MAAQWFCQIAGAEIGPLSSQQIKTMVANGRLLPSDAMRQGASGPWFPAARVKGLFPPGQAPGGTPAAVPASPARKNGHALPVARKTPRPRQRPMRGKKAPGGQGRAVRAARPIVVPAGQPKQPRQAAPAKASAVDELFPKELAGGIPVPEKAINFDKFAIDTTPVKVTGRKSSRVGGMSKEQYKKMMRIMAAVIGGALSALHRLDHDLLPEIRQACGRRRTRPPRPRSRKSPNPPTPSSISRPRPTPMARRPRTRSPRQTRARAPRRTRARAPSRRSAWRRPRSAARPRNRPPPRSPPRTPLPRRRARRRGRRPRNPATPTRPSAPMIRSPLWTTSRRTSNSKPADGWLPP